MCEAKEKMACGVCSCGCADTNEYLGSVIEETIEYVPGIPEVVIEPVHADFQMPEYASEGDSGMDVRSLEDYVLAPGQTKLFKLGFKMGIPVHPLHELGYRYECQVRPRSGLSMKTGLRVPNAPGTVDNFYVNEVGVLLTNTGSEDFAVLKGDRIAQLVFNEVIRPMNFRIGSVDGMEDRGGGFGHTGVK